MIVLAIDTTSLHGGVAVYRDATPLSQVLNTRPANLYSVTLFEMAELALAQSKLRFADVDLYAAANGPGSFTGIRVGLAAVQGWRSAFNRAARGVSVFEAMVETARPGTHLAIPIVDARRGEFYLNIFRRESHVAAPHDGNFRADAEGWVLDRAAIVRLLEKIPPAELASLAWVAREGDAASHELYQSLGLPGQWRTLSEPLLGAIARIARRGVENSEPSSPLDALYIRRSDAELNWRG